MEKGTLKIKESGKIVLKVGKFEGAPPTEFDFSGFVVGTYECEVERPTGTIVRVAVNGKDIPKKEVEVQRKAEQNIIKEQQILAEKERDKQAREEQRNPQLPTNVPVDSFLQKAAKLPSGLPSISREDLTTSNFALKLYKFARFDTDGKAKFFAKNRNECYFIDNNKYGLGQKINEISIRHKNNAEKLFNTDGCLKHGNFKPDWRVIVGLGTDSVYETGITLHHVYGFPFIPASAIKGITNHYAQDKGYDKAGNSNKDFYDAIFGSTKQQGKITFFDAMPISIPQLKPDIMNIHYPDYYGGSGPPTDTQSPRPIIFLTVENTAFQFIVGCKTVNRDLLQTAFNWLQSALKEKGIGAKTAVGYGYMK